MQKSKAVLIAAIITMVSILACMTTSYASTTNRSVGGGAEISPFYVYAYTVSTELDITGTTATAYARLEGNSSTKSISVTYTLQQKSGTSWKNVKSWTASKTGKSLSSQNSYSTLTKGAQYRVYATYTVTGTDGGSETISDYSGTYTC